MLDIFNFSEIYNEQAQYHIEKKQIEEWLVGEGFDNSEFYSIADQENLRRDIMDMVDDIVIPDEIKMSPNRFTNNLRFLLTAGAPGAGKTTVLRAEIERRKSLGEFYCYVCPDDVCLKNMHATFCSMRSVLNASAPDDALHTAKRCYNKWRPGSNAAAHLLSAHLLRGRFPVAFGTTSTSSLTSRSFSHVKKLGYKIEVLFVVAPDAVRNDSIKVRNRRFYQSTEKDNQEKALFLIDRVKDSFVPYADEIHFYWRESFDQGAILAASWKRKGELPEYQSGVDFLLDESQIEVFNKGCYDAFVKECILKHNELRQKRGEIENPSHQNRLLKY